MNRIKSLALLAMLTALLLWAGQALGGQTGLVFALLVAGVRADRLKDSRAGYVVEPDGGEGLWRLSINAT